MSKRNMNSSNAVAKRHSDTNQDKPLNNHLPQIINLSKWEDTGFNWIGTVAPSSFTRLDSIITYEHKQQPINVSCQLYKHSNVIWLSMSFKGSIWVTCQRCLQPVDIDVTHDAKLAILYDESQVSLLDEDADFLLLDEVIVDASIDGTSGVESSIKAQDLVDKKKYPINVKQDYLAQVQTNKVTKQLLPIAQLIEDELLLDIPLSAKHDNCKMILEQVGEIEEEEEESPFAALAALKGRL